MGWITEDGLHEGYLLPEFRDGQRGEGVIAGGVPPDEVVVEADYFAEPPQFVTRPASDVIGWRVMCACRSSDDGQLLSETHRWHSELITRVAFPQSEDVAGSRIFARDDEVVVVQERRDVGELVRSIWSEHHIRPDDAIRILKEASARAALANRDLERAIRTVFGLGLDARDIERAAGFYPMARHTQSQRTPLPRRVPGLTHHRSGPQP
jgi:hypothetical protein